MWRPRAFGASNARPVSRESDDMPQQAKQCTDETFRVQTLAHVWRIRSTPTLFGRPSVCMRWRHRSCTGRESSEDALPAVDLRVEASARYIPDELDDFHRSGGVMTPLQGHECCGFPDTASHARLRSVRPLRSDNRCYKAGSTPPGVASSVLGKQVVPTRQQSAGTHMRGKTATPGEANLMWPGPDPLRALDQRRVHMDKR